MRKPRKLPLARSTNGYHRPDLPDLVSEETHVRHIPPRPRPSLNYYSRKASGEFILSDLTRPGHDRRLIPPAYVKVYCGGIMREATLT